MWKCKQSVVTVCRLAFGADSWLTTSGDTPVSLEAATERIDRLIALEEQLAKPRVTTRDGE
ncbi:hypothetical protein EA473_11110 [Natrarchaeobius chitinivorans]|uniref:Uncharacterized protein n=1 Tax=Natrarchaeobius chitinivorans TaxID=1679083 RepID=A0A3N6PCQ4_NATCH|nr:hypothetical protein EA473_11110 [Natrarchaeobius chitinivorans]